MRCPVIPGIRTVPSLARFPDNPAIKFRVALSGEAGGLAPGPKLLRRCRGTSIETRPVREWRAPRSPARRVAVLVFPERWLVEVVARFLRPTTSLLVQMSQQNLYYTRQTPQNPFCPALIGTKPLRFGRIETSWSFTSLRARMALARQPSLGSFFPTQRRIFDQQTEHPLAFARLDLRVVPDTGEVLGQRENLLPALFIG